MNDLSNMPLVTPLLDTQWVPDGSGELPSPWETAAVGLRSPDCFWRRI